MRFQKNSFAAVLAAFANSGGTCTVCPPAQPAGMTLPTCAPSCAPGCRHRAPLCVSKLWRDACYAPALLRKLVIGRSFYEGDSWDPARLQALCAWLVRRRPVQHADSVWLSLFLPTSRHNDEPAEELSEVGMEEREALAACMAAISATASTRLHSLELFADCAVLTTAGWSAGLTSLTLLSLGNPNGRLLLSPELRSLRGVQDLSVYALEGVDGEHSMPLGTTKLSWDEVSGFDLPHTVSGVGGGKCGSGRFPCSRVMPGRDRAAERQLERLQILFQALVAPCPGPDAPPSTSPRPSPTSLAPHPAAVHAARLVRSGGIVLEDGA